MRRIHLVLLSVRISTVLNIRNIKCIEPGQGGIEIWRWEAQPHMLELLFDRLVICSIEILCPFCYYLMHCPFISGAEIIRDIMTALVIGVLLLLDNQRSELPRQSNGDQTYIVQRQTLVQDAYNIYIGVEFDLYICSIAWTSLRIVPPVLAPKHKMTTLF